MSTEDNVRTCAPINPHHTNYHFTTVKTPQFRVCNSATANPPAQPRTERQTPVPTSNRTTGEKWLRLCVAPASCRWNHSLEASPALFQRTATGKAPKGRKVLTAPGASRGKSCHHITQAPTGRHLQQAATLKTRFRPFKSASARFCGGRCFRNYSISQQVLAVFSCILLPARLTCPGSQVRGFTSRAVKPATMARVDHRRRLDGEGGL